MSSVAFKKTFTDEGVFAALNTVEDFLAAHGFSFGKNQRGEPTGILYGDFDIQKWRNLRANERKALHGIIEAGDHRNGPVTVTIYDTAPVEALDRLLSRTRATA